MYSLIKKQLLQGMILALCFIFSGCKTHPPTIIQKEEIIWTYKDSIVTKDSVCYIPIERYVDIVPIYDTLVLENANSISHSWVDTTNHMLKGELKSKNAIQYQIKYVERIVRNDSIVEKTKEIPVTIEVEKIRNSRFATVCIVWSIVSMMLIWILIYLKIKKSINSL